MVDDDIGVIDPHGPMIEDWKPLLGKKGYFEIDPFCFIANDPEAMKEIDKIIADYLRKTDRRKLFILSSPGKPGGFFDEEVAKSPSYFVVGNSDKRWMLGEEEKKEDGEEK